MSSSNTFPGPDIATLLSMIQGVGPQNVGQQLPRQQHQSTQSVLQGVVGNHVQSSTTSTDPSIMSSLLQGLAGAFNQQHQHQARNAPSDLLSLLSVQQFSHMGSGGQGLDLTRLAASGLLANLQSASNSAPVDQQPGPVQQAQALANLFSSQQGNKSNQTQEQALALARLAGARLLSSDESHRSESARKDSDSGQDRVKQQKEPMINNSSSFVANRQSATTPDVADDSARGRNLEPGAIAVPCRARGMPMDHNPLTAYFVIHNGIRHGEDVVCSHPSCRNAGVKFRYCSFCKAPVAKRNFRRRHNHGGDASTLESDDMEDENIKPATVNSITSCRIAPKVEDEREKKRTKLISSEDDNVDTTTDSSKSSSDNGRKANTNESHIKQERSEAPPKNAADNTTREGDSSTATIKTSGKSISQEQREAWAKLLEERPVTNDSESMSVWIDKILKVSDPVE